MTETDSAPVTISHLEDLGQTYELHGTCHSCGRTVRLNIMKLMHQVGNIPISTVKAYLVCNQCGSRETGVLLIWTGCEDFRY